MAVDSADCSEDVQALSGSITRRVDSTVSNGALLLEELHEVFPRLVLGARATEQVTQLSGSEPFYRQVLRHLRTLDKAARTWTAGASFSPGDLNYSAESSATLDHARYGPMRDFPTPDGFPKDRWTFHTKIPTGTGVRIYFKTRLVAACGPGKLQRLQVAIGYMGPHLPTVRFH